MLGLWQHGNIDRMLPLGQRGLDIRLAWEPAPALMALTKTSSSQGAAKFRLLPTLNREVVFLTLSNFCARLLNLIM